MTLELYPYQQAAVAEIATNGRQTYLADEMGLGKTPTAIAVAKKRGVKRLLILCPSVAKLTWIKEMKRWWPEMPVTVIDSPHKVAAMRNEGAYILSYALLSQSKSGSFDYTAAIRDIPTFDMSVLDEAHALKNGKSIRTRAVLITLKPVLGWVLPMSGTPTPNHPGELFPILRTLFPDTVRKTDGKLMRQYEFENTYCDVSQPVSTATRFALSKAANLDQLKTKLEPFVIRRSKRKVLPHCPT